ncbi:hypothetical protein RFI_11487, partial [Reticulomyxa filosa]
TEKSKDKQSDNKKPTGAPTLEQSRETPAIVEIAKATETNTLNTTSVDSKIQRTDTIAQIQEMQQSIHQLPQLHGFLEKKSGKRFGGWQKRWFIVKRTHLLWSKKEQYIDNPLDIKERRKFQNSLTLLQLSSVVVDSSDKKKQRQFIVESPRKKYFFRAKNITERDLWVNGLQLHLKALAESMNFINDKVMFRQKTMNNVTKLQKKGKI